MANGAYIGVDGTARKIRGLYVGVDGKARKIMKAYIGVNGVAKLCWASANPVFAENTWEEIIAACKSGGVPSEWKVGDQKTMTINGKEHVIDIIGKNHDDYADGSGKAPLTFQMHDCYNKVYVFNGSSGNTWSTCKLRNTSLPEILALMPAEVQSGIREVSKKTAISNNDSTIATTADKLFLLSEVEVFNTTSKSYAGEGAQYAYYAAGNRTIKNAGSEPRLYWLRSPSKTSNFICAVNDAGAIAATIVSNTQGVAFAFCF